MLLHRHCISPNLYRLLPLAGAGMYQVSCPGYAGSLHVSRDLWAVFSTFKSLISLQSSLVYQLFGGTRVASFYPGLRRDFLLHCVLLYVGAPARYESRGQPGVSGGQAQVCLSGEVPAGPIGHTSAHHPLVSPERKQQVPEHREMRKLKTATSTQDLSLNTGVHTPGTHLSFGIPPSLR